MKKIAVLVYVLVVILGLVSGCAKTPEAYIEKAEKAERSDTEKAIDNYELAIDLDEWNQDAWLGLAELYADKEEFDELNNILKDIYKELEEFKDEDKMYEELIEYIELIQDEDPEELGRWADEFLAEESLAKTPTEISTVDVNYDTSESIKFGMIGALSGDIGIYGNAVLNGALLAVNEINAESGILGRNIELISYDSEGDPTKALNLYNRLRNEDGMDALIGGVFSGESIAIGSVANGDGLPMISPTATNSAVTEGLEYVFRACFMDAYQGEVVAAFASDYLNADSAIVLTNISNDYSINLSEAFKSKFEGIVLEEITYTYSDNDFTDIAEIIKQHKAEFIFLPDYKQTVGVIVEQLKDANVKAVIVGGDGWDGIQENFPIAMEGHYYLNHYSKEESIKADVFESSYQAQYNEVASILAALAYDSVYIMAEAMNAAGTTNGEDVIMNLNEIKYSGVTGNIWFDRNGNPKDKGAAVLRIKNGDPVFIERITN